MMEIRSLQNPLIQHWIRLKCEKKYREEKKQALLIGETLIREFQGPILSLISTEPTHQQALKEYIVSLPILKKISGLSSPCWIAEVSLPEPQSLDLGQRVLILDQIQDPGNMGMLLRTCLALNWDGVIATVGTVDFFNDKVLRSSVGAIFRLPFCWKSSQEISDWIGQGKRQLWIADMEGKSLDTQTFSTPLALLLSHEGQGVQSWAKQCGNFVKIPLSNQVESLNVASAGSILLYQMRGDL